MEDLLFLLIYFLFEIVAMLGLYKTGQLLITVFTLGQIQSEPFVKGEYSQGSFFRSNNKIVIGKYVVLIVGALFWVLVITGLAVWL